MTLLPDTLTTLASQGASLRVDAKRLSINQLAALAAAVADAGGTLTLVNAASLTPQHAAALVAVGGRNLDFDLT